MESVRIVATPEAYQVIQSLENTPDLHFAVAKALSLAASGGDDCDGHQFSACSLMLFTRWAKSPSDESVIIISHKFILGDFDEVLPTCLPVCVT